MHRFRLVHTDYKLFLACNKQSLNWQHRLIVKFLSVLKFIYRQLFSIYFWEIHMKFQLKALVAALALVAAVPAQAAIAPGSTGNGELVLTVWDQVANISATFDLGKSYSEFSIAGTAFPNSGVTANDTAFSWNLSTDAGYSTAWGQFLAASNSANTVYAIGASDAIGAGAGSRGLITSFAEAGNNITTGQVQNATVNFDAYTNGTSFGPSVLFENHSLVANGSSVANAGAGYALAQYGITSKVGANSGIGAKAIGAIGSNLQVAQYVTAGSSFATAPLTIFGNGAKFNLSNTGLLTYTTNVTAVPEADTWAMMLLGLGFMGFVARRKQA